MATDANPPYRFGGLLARARRSWVEQIRERMQEAGFPGYRQSDAWVLALLLQRPLAIGQLGEAQGISRQAARQMADGLVERGYATFGTDDADARRTLVVLTRRGKAYGRAIWMAQDALNETVRSRVSEADLAAADAVLRAVFPDDNARQRIDERMPPPSVSPLSGCNPWRLFDRPASRARGPSGALRPAVRPGGGRVRGGRAVRAMWLHGALARGKADAASDMDVSVAIADDGFDSFAASWRDWLAAITPTLTARPLAAGSFYALTPSCERFDVIAEPVGKLPATSLTRRLVVFDRDGLDKLIPPPADPPPDPAVITYLIEETLRQAANFPRRARP